MLILGLESSCDETSASVIEVSDDCRGRRIVSNIIASQIEVHRLYGGVVPEIASRAHTEAITRVTTEALEAAAITPDALDAVAVTCKPGLIGALLVGVAFAKGFAYRYNKPLIGVNHVHGHAAAAYLAHADLDAPFLALVASGGHTSIMDVRGHTDYVTVGITRDDAIGEAFDKVARVMGLPYPGGAEMDRLCAEYLRKNDKPPKIKFPSAAINDDTLDFSFSGLKTAVINHLHTLTQRGEEIDREEIAAAFTLAVVDAVKKKLGAALDRTGRDTLVIAGGVAANSHLRRAAEELAADRGLRLRMPPPSLCGDNGAMIAMQGAFEFMDGNVAPLDLGASATSRR